jgi:hypothetical protein
VAEKRSILYRDCISPGSKPLIDLKNRKLITAALRHLVNEDTFWFVWKYEYRGIPFYIVLIRMAGTTRLELATSAVTGQRSNQLNYVPAIVLLLVGGHGFEPRTFPV